MALTLSCKTGRPQFSSSYICFHSWFFFFFLKWLEVAGGTGKSVYGSPGKIITIIKNSNLISDECCWNAQKNYLWIKLNNEWYPSMSRRKLVLLLITSSSIYSDWIDCFEPPFESIYEDCSNSKTPQMKTTLFRWQLLLRKKSVEKDNFFQIVINRCDCSCQNYQAQHWSRS